MTTMDAVYRYDGLLEHGMKFRYVERGHNDLSPIDLMVVSVGDERMWLCTDEGHLIVRKVEDFRRDCGHGPVAG